MFPRLFCLVDERVDPDVLPVLAQCGVTGFQVRAKRLGDRALAELACRVVELVRPHAALVVVDDRLDVALASTADGVHLGATDLPVRLARRAAPRLLIGATCRNRDDVLRARDEGADYAGFGPLFATTSKSDLPDPVGVAALTAATGVLPLIGIGGIDAGSAGAVRAAGAHGVAVIGGIWHQRDPVQAAKELVAAVG